MAPLILAFLAVALVYGVLSAFLPDRIRLSSIRRRDSISYEQLHSEYFGDSEIDAAVFGRIWNEIGRALRLPPDRLRPTDRLEDELKVPFFPLVNLNEGLDDLLARRYEARPQWREVQKLVALRDVVLLIARLDESTAGS